MQLRTRPRDARAELTCSRFSRFAPAAKSVLALRSPRFMGAGFAVVDKVTRYKLWEQIVDDKNVALGIVVAGMFIAIGQIVAAAIHG